MCRLRPLTCLPPSKPRGPSLCGGHRGAVHTPGARLGRASDRDAHLASELIVQPCPGAVLAPTAEVAVDRVPVRVLGRQRSPLAPRPEHVQDAVDHTPQVHLAWTAIARRYGQQSDQQFPFPVAEIARITPRAHALAAAGSVPPSLRNSHSAGLRWCCWAYCWTSQHRSSSWSSQSAR